MIAKEVTKDKVVEKTIESTEVATTSKTGTSALSNFESATEVKMKIKAKEKAGTVSAKVSISHNMLTYDQAKKKGKEANFITHIYGIVNDKVVYDASTSQFLSKNPLIKFKFAGKKGEIFTASKTIK